jgi:hypothetical protein
MDNQIRNASKRDASNGGSNVNKKTDESSRDRSQAKNAPEKDGTAKAGAASAGLAQTSQSGERSAGANPDQPPGTPATQPRTRTVTTQPGEPYNDDTELRH